MNEREIVYEQVKKRGDDFLAARKRELYESKNTRKSEGRIGRIYNLVQRGIERVSR